MMTLSPKHGADDGGGGGDDGDEKQMRGQVKRFWDEDFGKNISADHYNDKP